MRKRLLPCQPPAAVSCIWWFKKQRAPSSPYRPCCGALPKGAGRELLAAEGGGCRTRGRSGSSAASVVPLAGTFSAEGSGSSRPIDLRAADATTPRRTVRASTRRTTPQRHTADFHLAQNEKLDFILCLQACRSFARQKIGEPPARQAIFSQSEGDIATATAWPRMSTLSMTLAPPSSRRM